ncbi:lysine--tRNA ligase [Tessaracoccus sp. OH4464_COT-324]|uniref:lysine--tRNA ligase n=1 Tax=Tessaracoccus sp. OH4464_COT-324 TaxID=2491059 RepID=UPI000F643A42|nr:lysine--tRNA ligase [Tessaracoccus sp. OH4464_COT-324]RRD45959.1 lysine--tRNA ligase [Tessaracoccus sp. OH4464_COT-324]
MLPNDSEQTAVRKEKRARLLAAGVEPYPADLKRTHSLAEVRAGWQHLETGQETDDVVAVGGRVVFIRNTGKLAFATLQDGFGPTSNGERLQVMLSLAEVGEEALAAWKSDVDLGDHVWVQGRVIVSKRGELSVMAASWRMASKALRPLPVLHKELSEEARVRRRYVDLIVRDEAREMVRKRSAITRAVRDTLYARDYLEVETPILQLMHGGAAARPFGTHLNAFGIDMSLRIALELHLKRTMVGGADRVFEMGRVFRNEGVDSSHSPEFTMLEAYQAWGDQFTVANLTRDIFLAAADAVGSRQLETPKGTVDLDGEWRWLPVFPALSEELGEEITADTALADLQRHADAREVEYDPKWDAGKLAMELFAELIEPTLVQPTFVCDYPCVAQPLARINSEVPGQVLAWDLIIGGMERGTGFTELIDPVIQRDVLTAQSLRAAAGDPEAMQLDVDFIESLEYGVPPMGGLGVGIDRLIMLLTGVGIRETILYPLLRPQA